MNNNIMGKIKELHWYKMDADITNIGIKGKTLGQVYGRYSDAKARSYRWCIDKMYKFINDYKLLLINYGISSSNCNFYTFEFLMRDELDNKYLIVETAHSSKYYTSNQFLIKASRKYRKQLKAQG